MPTDHERVVSLLRHFGDPVQVADILGTDLATVHDVLTNGGSLPAAGGGGFTPGTPVANDQASSAPNVWHAVADPSKVTLVSVVVEFDLNPGDQRRASLWVGDPNDPLAQYDVADAGFTRDSGDTLAGSIPQMVALTGIVAAGQSWQLIADNGVGTQGSYETPLG